MISLITVSDVLGNIGYDNKLLCNLPEDMSFFKEKTLGNTVVMGRKTFESIGTPLPDRGNIVFTRQDNYKAKGAATDITFEDFIEYHDYRFEYFIIGGSEIYEQFLPLADRIYMTVMNTMFKGKKFDKFPLSIGDLTNCDEWKNKLIKYHIRDDKNKFDLMFHQFDRIK